MKHQKRSYAIIFGCVMIICGFFLPWFSSPFIEYRGTTISGFQMWLGGLDDVTRYTSRIAPELFTLLWLLPLAALLTCALSVLEMFKPKWDSQWIRLTAYATLLLTMGLFIWPVMIMMSSKIAWGLWLCLIGWLFSLLILCLNITISQQPGATSVVPLPSQQYTRRSVVRGLVGLTGLSSLSLGGFLRTSWIYHQRTIFTYRYIGQGRSPDTNNAVIRVSWSPTGKRILVGQWPAPLQSWDAFTGDNVHTYPSSSANASIWSPDSQYIALGYLGIGDYADIVVINAITGVQVATFPQTKQTDGVGSSFAWSPNSQYLAIGNVFTPVVTLWNPFTRAMGEAYSIPTQTDTGITEIRDLAWSPDGQYFAASIADASMLDDGTIDSAYRATPVHLLGIYIWHVQSGELLLHFHAETPLDFERGSVLNWSPDGKRLAFTNKTTIHLLDLALQRPVLTYTGHSLPPSSVAWPPDGKHIASSGYDRTVQVWNASTGVLRFLYQGHSSIVSDVAWSPDSKYLASGGNDGTVQVWQPGL